MWGKHYKKKGQFEAVATEPEGPKESRNGFASQLHFLVDTLQMSFKAHFIKYFVTAAENPSSYNLKSSTVVPSPTVRDRVLKELFIEEAILTVTSDIWSTNLPHGQGTGVLGYQRVK
ncbi:Rab3 GTPase-activating protein catalytic protein [Trifolium repens]|nr:Rab3 GTPase-activating protein catalytic protein [Trifolium repens]